MEKLVFKGIESVVISENIVYYIYDVRKLDITLAGKKLRDKSVVYLYTADEGDVQINIIGSSKSIDTSSMTNGKCYKLMVNATSDIDFEELNETNEGGGGGGSADFNQTFYDLFGVHAYTYIVGAADMEYVDKNGNHYNTNELIQRETGNPIYVYSTFDDVDIISGHIYISLVGENQISNIQDITDYISFLSQNNTSIKNYYLCKFSEDEGAKYYKSYVGSDYLNEVTPEFPCIVKYLDTVPDGGWVGHWNAGGLYLQTRMPDQINFDFGTYIGSVLRNYVSVTYDILKTTKKNGMLEPGMKYRITDYQTVANNNSITANWRYMFDIVVTAIDNRTLSENAEICLHELTEQEQEDEVTNYLTENHKLGMWKVKYTLDYHASYWYDKDLPDAPDYKGLIYMMRDLNGIEMPYDFWNLPNGLQEYQNWALDQNGAPYTDIVIKAANIGDMPTVSFPHPDGSRPGYTKHVFVNEGCSDIIISGANSNINIGRSCSGIHTESMRDSVIMDGAKNLTLTGGNYGETTNITYKVVIMGLDYEDTGTSQPTALAVPGSKDYTTYIGKNSQGVVTTKNLFD